MRQTMQRGRRKAPGGDANPRWATLIEDDAIGIDGDIERLIGLYQVKFGYTHNRANAELVRRLSSLVGPAGVVLEDVCC